MKTPKEQIIELMTGISIEQWEENNKKLESIMKFDRDKLEEEVLKKVKEVNEESGYRPYFELPEYVHIVASIMEEKFKVEYDDFVNQIHLLSKELDKAQIKAETLEEELMQLKGDMDVITL